MFAVVVTFQIRPDSIGEFMPLMLENARTSLADEPGCNRFDVCSDEGRPGEVFLYELYTDAAAFEAHKTMPHFVKFDGQTAEMIETKVVSTYEKVDQ